MAPLLEALALTKTFGPITAVGGVTFTLSKGEVLGFLGPNGAGKTTTMKMLTGFLRPSSGQAFIAGVDVNHDPIAAKRRLGYLPEGAPAYDDMTPASFLDFIAAARGLSRDTARTAIDRAVQAAHLTTVTHQPIETLSKGFKRRVGLAQALLHDPDVLVLDEPTDGLDPNQKHEMRKLIRAMASEKAIVISTHILEEVEAVCSRAIVIDKGRVVADGTPADLRGRSRFHNAVTLVIESGDEARVQEVLASVRGVRSVEIEREPRGRLIATTLPADGAPILDAITNAARVSGLAVVEIAVDPGRLDDVFRSLTTAEQGTEERRTGLQKGA